MKNLFRFKKEKDWGLIPYPWGRVVIKQMPNPLDHDAQPINKTLCKHKKHNSLQLMEIE